MARDTKLSIIVDAEDRASKTLSGIRGKLDGMQPALKQLSVASTVAFGALATGTGFAIKAASDLGESINAVNVSFGDSADKIKEFGKTSAKQVGLSNRAFNQLATNTGVVLTNTGKDMDDVADMTIELTTRAADLASVMNVDVEQALNAMRSGLIGQSEPLRNLGVVMSEAEVKSFALAAGIIETDREMTESEKTFARYKFIMEKSTFAAGDFANTSGSLANQQRTLKATLEDLGAQIGQNFQPIIEQLQAKLIPLLEGVVSWVQANPELTKTIIIVALAVTGLVAVVSALSLAMIAINPVALGVGLVIGGLVLIVHNVVKSIMLLKDHWQEVWIGIKLITAEVVNSVIGFVEDMVNSIIFGINAVINSINALVSKLAAIPKIGQQFADFLSIPTLDDVSFNRINTDNIVSPLTSAGGNNVQINIQGNNFAGEDDFAEAVGDKIVQTLKLNTQL